MSDIGPFFLFYEEPAVLDQLVWPVRINGSSSKEKNLLLSLVSGPVLWKINNSDSSSGNQTGFSRSCSETGN